MTALGDRLLAVEDGDLVSPAPRIVQRTMPKLAAAVDSLFAEVRASIENAHALGMYDPVTSLPNRLHFRSEADKMLGDAATGTQSAMLFVDLDRFKKVNDSLGHARGDQLLIMVANRLRVVVTAEFPSTDRGAGRCSPASPATSSPCSSPRFRRPPRSSGSPGGSPWRFPSRSSCHGHSVDIGASIGVAISPDHGNSIESLMRAADIAMYRAKARGGGQHCLFRRRAGAPSISSKIDTENALTEAVQRGEFVLAFQPQLSLVTGEIIGAEALLRWNHPRDGMRMPNSFIPIAEQTGIIAEIGDWVIAEVASMLGDWHRDGIDAAAGVQRQPAPARPRRFLRAAAAGVRGRWRAAVAGRAGIHRDRGDGMPAKPCWPRSRRFASDGATIAIDDFGTGYSNLARLRAMPLDRVKLDPSLIADIETEREGPGRRPGGDPADQGRRLRNRRRGGRDVAQADILRAMGCDTVQGFVFAEPMFEEEYLRLDAGMRRGRRGWSPLTHQA